MNCRTVDYYSHEYQEIVALRYRVLRRPLGLQFKREDLEKETGDIFCICEDGNVIVACNILSKQTNDTIKLRQMAVDEAYRSKGVGTLLLHFAEKTAKNLGFNKIILHARKTALGFYLKNAYEIISDEFFEIDIPHYKMQKQLH